MKPNGWTLERRARQAETIRRWKPWEQSTGPRTNEGKVRCGRNAFKGGGWRETRALIKALNQAIREQQARLSELA